MSDHEYGLSIYRGKKDILFNDTTEDYDLDLELDTEEVSTKENIDNISKTDIYPLKNTWVFYDHTKSDSETYESNTRKLCEISDIVKFWQVFNNYPLPSKLFNNGVHRPLMNSREISSLSVFKKGIVPKWEDPVNKFGAEISKRKFNRKNQLEEVDRDWINLLMMCIGSSIDNGITGIRVVDSSSYKKNEHTGVSDFKLLYRIELWFDNCSNKTVMEDHFKTILNIDDARLIHYKEHNLV